MAKRVRVNAADVPVDPGPPGTWTSEASCAYTPLDLLDFFGGTRENWTTSKQVCKECPVRRECLTYALDARATYGVWGGLNPIELRFALGRNAQGEVWAYNPEVRCPYCRSATVATRTTEQLVTRTCSGCGFEWERGEYTRVRRRRRRTVVVAVTAVAVTVVDAPVLIPQQTHVQETPTEVI